MQAIITSVDGKELKVNNLTKVIAASSGDRKNLIELPLDNLLITHEHYCFVGDNSVSANKENISFIEIK